jgi:hypothetical protein
MAEEQVEWGALWRKREEGEIWMKKKEEGKKKAFFCCFRASKRTRKSDETTP